MLNLFQHLSLFLSLRAKARRAVAKQSRLCLYLVSLLRLLRFAPPQVARNDEKRINKTFVMLNLFQHLFLSFTSPFAKGEVNCHCEKPQATKQSGLVFR
jgi:hypothetical protein